MKHILTLLFVTLTIVCQGQDVEKQKIKMFSEFASNDEILDILRFEGINYFKINFVGGEEMKTKSYKITVKNILDGEVPPDSIFVDPKRMGIERLININDTVLSLRVLAKRTPQNKLKISINFPGFSCSREFDAIEMEDSYSLRNIAEESHLTIEYGKPFYLLAYILPYDMGNGIGSYCEVGRNGKDILNWGKKFGIKHYLVFEMTIE